MFFPDWSFIVSTNNAYLKVQCITTETRGLFLLYRNKKHSVITTALSGTHVHVPKDGKHTKISAYKLILLQYVTEMKCFKTRYYCKAQSSKIMIMAKTVNTRANMGILNKHLIMQQN